MLENQKNKINCSQYLILVDNRNDKRLIRPADHKNFKWRKITVKLAQLSQFEYYQTVEVGNDKLTPIQDQFEEEQVCFNDEDGLGEEGDGENNRRDDHIVNNNKQIYTIENAQKLQPQQIQQLKQTKKGEEIIQTIVENNEQFDKRTIYSKEKYLAKKKRKYLFQFHAEPVSLQNLHQYYFGDDPKAINWIRWDMFAFFLLQASPFENSNILLAEKSKGIFIASALIKGATNITAVTDEQKSIKRFPIVQQMNVSKQTFKNVIFTDWKGLKQQAEQPHPKYSHLLMAGNYDFAGIIQTVLPLLQNGCIICLYCQYNEPLQAALQVIRKNQKFIHYKLYDSFARQYQVLKNRTHPMMSMSSHSGYLLTAFTVGS